MVPDYSQFLCEAWGWDPEIAASLGSASNVVVGSNPAYSAGDFLALYPKFGGAPATPSGALTAGSPVVTGITVTGLAIGQLVAGPGILPGTTIAAIGSNQITLSLAAAASGTVTITVYTAPLLPLAVLNAYISLASASLVQARWQDAWVLGMALYVVHFVTLWLRSDGDVYSSAGQAAAAGLARGIGVSKSAGPVSISHQMTPGLEAWGSWNDTEYGKQFATMARLMGGGPMWLW